MTSFLLEPIAPFRLDLTVWVLRRLPINDVDRWDGETYRRVLVLGGLPREVAVTQTSPPEAPELRVTLSGGDTTEQDVEAARRILRKMLGLDVDLSGFHRQAEADEHLGRLVRRFIGFKPPTLGSVFEALLNAVACQQLSLVVGITLLNRLTANYGLSAGDHRSFPTPQDLAGARAEDLRKLGFSRRKSDSMLAYARGVTSGELDLESLNGMDDRSVVSRLCELSGVGRWSAEYVALRGLGRLDVFPADDVGSQNKLRDWFGLNERPEYAGMHRILDQWAPYRGLIYFYLLLDFQSKQGLVP